jgi:ATP-dependent DNA helicase DinG
MSDFLERLNRRLRRKRAEEPVRRAVESEEAGAPEPSLIGSGQALSSPEAPSTTKPSPETAAAPLRPDAVPLPKDQNDRADIALVFAPDGPVAHLLGSSYRPRRSQALMARLVKRALDESQHALIEAGTGSGKSFAYLIPLIWSGRRAFVSTANKTLQNQLWEKDIPALQRIAPRKFSTALLKGRGNYVCRVKLKALSQQLTLPGLGFSIGDLLARLEETPSGDVEELRLFGELRDALTVGQHDCLGHNCPLFSRCYYELARVRAEKADIVVVNHALLAFNMVLDGQIVQPRDVIVIDEAHEFERYVVGALRLKLEYDQVPAFVNDAVVTRNAGEDIRGRAVHANHELFTYLAQRGGRNDERRWASPRELPLARVLADHVNAVCKQLLKRYPPVLGADERLVLVQDKCNEENARHQMAIEWAQRLADEILTLSRPAPDDAVRYCEQGTGKTQQARAVSPVGPNHRVVLCQEPVEVAEFLRESLWQATSTVVCTSATLTVNQEFDYFRWQTGVPRDGALRQVIDSPFDYPNQALLYTPHGLYPQYGEGEEAYVQKLAAEVERLVRASRGRAFVLCTSARRTEQLFHRLAPRLPYACYCQGMAPRSELLDLFRNDASGAVLFATKSFWEGVDVPGEALSLVIIDKLPFAPHRDPVVQHRGQRIRDAGGNPFLQYALPEAILALKQGVGRLIRAETDRGVMAVLDSRINTKRYGPRMIVSLPRARRTLQFEGVVAFFEAEDSEAN